ncbi:hypothetical protein [Leifsonia sp. EB34]|uniref:hypothetical protein n=1 Tax=Leifsonia sp. EB34 TaxID=3156303 RepID=UPI0035157720
MRKPGALTIVVIATGGLLAGCSATAAPTPHTTAAQVSVGEDAAAIGRLIPGCSNVMAGDVAAGGPNLTSTATCTLDGHTVNINSWSDSSDANLDEVFQSDHVEGYYAAGAAWTVTLGDDPTIQYQLTNQADKLLQSSFSGSTPAPVNVSAEKQVASDAAKALGGQLRHVSG